MRSGRLRLDVMARLAILGDLLDPDRLTAVANLRNDLIREAHAAGYAIAAIARAAGVSRQTIYNIRR